MHYTNQQTLQPTAPKRTKNYVGRFFAVLATIILVILISLFSIVTFICKGPSPYMRNLFVTTVMETSAAKFLAYMYFTPEEIQVILDKNTVVEMDEVTNIDIDTPFEKSENDLPLDTIEVIDVSSDMFKGKMMIVHDPSRVCVATTPKFGLEESGTRVLDMVKNAGAVAGINASGFADLNGVGTGGQPLGIVIQDSKLVFGDANQTNTVVGFDQNNKLIVGKMTGHQALELNMRDAVCFGPVFIVNGKAIETAGTGGGLNPRTVIGQRADGAVLLLVIDGRQASSLGATYGDCIEVMLEFGAVNACNLDGGSSTVMVYNDEIINSCASLYGPRKIPTAIIVK